MLAVWAQAGLVTILEDEIRFWNGAKIWLCHCKDEKHRFKYLGAEIHVLLIDELTTFTDVIYRFLRSRVRAPGLALPDEYKGMFPRILAGSNPGNIGHVWVKAGFVDLLKPCEPKQMSDSEGGMLREYIPAKLADNPSMSEDDPDYVRRLRGLGSEALVKAMENGDWDVIEGAFFDNWSEDLKVKPFSIPDHWLRFRSFDWGSAKPFSVGWWAVVSEPYIHGNRVLPTGALVRYLEWYGAKKDENNLTIPNTGLKLTAEMVGDGIRERTTTKVDYSVADPAIFTEDGGPSIEERMGIPFSPADNKRVASKGHIGGWDQMRDRINGQDGKPMIYYFDTCADSARTIPALQHDQHRPEDIDTNMEDHAADEWRYACMSRPWVKPVEQDDKDTGMSRYNFNKQQADSWKTV